MSRRCEICGKEPKYGNVRSHANNRSRRRFMPNLQRTRALVDGQAKRINVCTRCLRSGNVVKPSLKPKNRAVAAA